MAPLSVALPAPVLSRPRTPASTALAVPACRSNAVLLVSVPLAIAPPVRCTPATVLLKPPRSKLPPLTTSVLALASRFAAPSASVPAATVVAPV